MNELSLRRWSDGDLDLLRLANTAEMTAHLNGPETEEQVIARHERYLRLGESGEAWMFVVIDGDRPLGSIGCWRTDWHGEAVFETGWFVVPEAQGQRAWRRRPSRFSSMSCASTAPSGVSSWPSPP